MILVGMYGKPNVAPPAPAITLSTTTTNADQFTFSNGNLTATRALGSSWLSVFATVSKSTGKWYWEALCQGGGGTTSGTVRHQYGVGDGAQGYPGQFGTGYGYDGVGRKWNSASTAAYGATWVAGDRIMVALDMDNGRIFFGKNGTWQASGNPAAGTNPTFTGLSGAKFPQFGLYPNSPQPQVTVNFGATAFTYTPPSGFIALTP